VGRRQRDTEYRSLPTMKARHLRRGIGARAPFGIFDASSPRETRQRAVLDRRGIRGATAAADPSGLMGLGIWGWRRGACVPAQRLME